MMRIDLVARAAIDAITNRNHHYFVGLGHTGRSFRQVNEGDTSDAR